MYCGSTTLWLQECCALIGIDILLIKRTIRHYVVDPVTIYLAIAMPRITSELIADSPQFTNPVKDWELDLRGMWLWAKFVTPLKAPAHVAMGRLSMTQKQLL